MKYLLIVILSFFIINLNAQIPGYLGKKFAIGYDFNFIPVVNGLFPVPRLDAPRVFFSTKHELQAGFTFSKRNTIQVSYIYQNNKTYGDHYYNYWVTPSGAPMNDHFYKVQTTVLDFNLKTHLGKFIAPVGTYIEFGYGLCKIGVPSTPPSISYHRISLGFGNTKMITNFLYFNLGIKINKNFKFTYIEPELHSFDDTEITDTYLGSSVRAMNWMEAKIGFGLLF